MAHHTHGLKYHHKRTTSKNSNTNWKKFMDKAVYFVGLIALVLTLPQAYKVWFLKDVSGVSTISWFGYSLVALTWFFYGVAYKEKPIMIINAIWVVMDLSIVVGLLVYGSGF